MTRTQIRKWMLNNAERFMDRHTGEINCTALTEAWDSETQNGAVTLDPDHVAWDVAVQVSDAVERAARK
jgi:hypothetical protein